jgi:hypothetical protein
MCYSPYGIGKALVYQTVKKPSVHWQRLCRNVHSCGCCSPPLLPAARAKRPHVLSLCHGRRSIGRCRCKQDDIYSTTANLRTGSMTRTWLEELRMRSVADFAGEADSRHTCHCTNSSTTSMSRASRVTHWRSKGVPHVQLVANTPCTDSRAVAYIWRSLMQPNERLIEIWKELTELKIEPRSRREQLIFARSR